MSNLLTSGTQTPLSGQYQEVGPRGGVFSGLEVTSVQGKRLPPTSIPGNKFKLVDRTKHKK
jgi:hypothetical protein